VERILFDIVLTCPQRLNEGRRTWDEMIYKKESKWI